MLVAREYTCVTATIIRITRDDNRIPVSVTFFERKSAVDAIISALKVNRGLNKSVTNIHVACV